MDGLELDRNERAPISAATRTLLCDLAAGDLERPLHRVDADWEEVFQAVCRNGLLGLTRRYLAHRSDDDYPPAAFRECVQEAYRTLAIRMTLIYRQVGDVLSGMAESGVECLVLKGPALAHTVYPDPFLRSFNDLDLCVRERDWPATHRLLCGLGFQAEDDLAEPPPKLVPQGVRDERHYWHERTGFLVEVHYDDLLRAGLAARDSEGFRRRSASIDVDGAPARVLSLEDQLIYLCAHVHYHGYGRLIWLSDIAFILRDHGAGLRWPRLLETVRAEEVQVGVYYTLHWVQALLGVGAPPDVLDTLRPDSFRRWAHERYAPEGQVLSWQPMRYPYFSFYFRPLLRRLLPDLLVMGRRRDKMHYLFRLLTPPAAWLRHHYRLNGPAAIAVQYVLHPLKLVYHYLEEIPLALFAPSRYWASEPQ